MTDMDFMKFVDELQGQIDKLKKMVKMAEKSDVAITPALSEGVKVADFDIDGNEGSIYSPAQVNADWNAAEGAAQILNKPTIPDVNSAIIARIGDLCISRHIVEFTFTNTSSAAINVSDVLPDGHTMIAVAGSALGGSFAFGFNTAKTAIAAKYTENLNATFQCNLIVFSVAPTRTSTKKKTVKEG